ncbi:MAG: 16S rRNA (guanine966-N2)-methyltransferase [Motiliproteus sp.]|jgi:16S rRNA (guanine966-N2)-methyltransferase
MARRASPPRSGSKPSAPSTANNKLRIIGGRWRSRKLEFASLPGLRPTTDRVRETLFNWLQQQVPGARCLDLFAGSGALGLEALSRGAKQVTLVDSAAVVVQQLRQNLALLGAEQDASVIHSQAIRWLQDAPTEQTFDLVFLDPPFAQGMLAGCCEALEQQALLSPQSWIYIEAEKTLQPLPVPANWRLERSLNAGQVSCYLFQRDAEE